jgi:hypothetical protein
MTDKNSGYSGTPLTKKLGIKEGSRIALVSEPERFLRELGPLPAAATIISSNTKGIDLILLFVESESQLIKNFEKFSKRLKPAGMLWVAWPKKSSGVATDLSFDVVQRIGLAAGLVDTKICAIDEVWSGLRFVIRLKDR